MAGQTQWRDLLADLVNACLYRAETGDDAPYFQAMHDATMALEHAEADDELACAMTDIRDAERAANRETVI